MNTTNTEIYNRSKCLIEQYILFLASLEIQEKKYAKCISLDNLLQLKSVLSNINNILTLVATKAFAIKLAEILNLSKEDTSKLINEIENKKANSNGFDILLNSENYKIAIEIKCNMPINNGEKLGSQQKNGIWDDALKLIKGGKKGKASVDTQDYIKIVAIANLDHKKLDSIINSIITKVQIKSEEKKRIDRINVIDKLVRLSSLNEILSIIDKKKVYIIPIPRCDIENELTNILNRMNLNF